MNRREFLAGVGGTAVALSLKSSRGAHAASTITLGFGSGGPYAEAVKKHEVDAFEPETGIPVQFVMGSSAAQALQIRANPKNPPFDVFCGSHIDLANLVNEGFMEVLPEEKVPNMRDVPSIFKPPFFKGRAVGHDYGAIGISYSTASIASPPTSWRDFVDRTAAGEFGRNVFFPNVPVVIRGPEIMMLIAKAFTNDTLNFAAALEQVKRMKPYIVKFFNTPSDPVTLLEQREGTIGPGWDARTWAGADATGGKMAWLTPKEGSPVGVYGLAALKNAQTELAFKLINHMLRPDLQSRFAAEIGNAVSNAKAQYPPKIAKRIAKFEDLFFPDPNIVITNSPKWFEAWNREIVG
jgi:putative spermidine/putrescine transport system substrate-binding protein